jgi:hypothetical protein
MFKVMLSTWDMDIEECVTIAEGFEHEFEALDWIDDNAEEFPERNAIWVESETFSDVWGDEAMDNVMHGGDFNNSGEFV